MNPLDTTFEAAPAPSPEELPDSTDQAAPRLTPARLRVLSLLAFVGLWWLLAHSGKIPPLFLPGPEAVLAKLGVLATVGFMDATLWQHLGASLARILLGLALAVLIGIPLGVLMGRVDVARALLDPLVEAWRPVPPLAYLPLIVIWFGIGELSKVILITLQILAAVLIATAHGVRHVSPERLRAAESLGASRRQLLWHVVLPEALPDIVTGIRIGLGTGWSTLVAAELVAATRGLGFMVQSAAQFLATDVVVLGILVIALVAFALELGLRALQQHLAPWALHKN
ncbi:MAG: taurine ABC transporter permease TauC [Paludibacterium sp.]|uniref:taurine ABC transporter permease TauC n=1 Tax=Paludibacterium sp. TaxID=1917523 RepID=UPI0025F80E95|nr:taurine ABC transporter permease TauC [Paludibacterium sp.]MBV8046884.1 taurine ABC transporter permease TauC [Paludibacterium sp.]MBV8648356.1 taurine ABC transporter permease TauC [Paludibacterium sp.]